MSTGTANCPDDIIKANGTDEIVLAVADVLDRYILRLELWFRSCFAFRRLFLRIILFDWLSDFVPPEPGTLPYSGVLVEFLGFLALFFRVLAMYFLSHVI